MDVGAVGAVGSGVASVYAALSPFLNGVRRTSNAAAAAQLQASAAATSSAATASATTPNAQLASPVAPPPVSPTDSVLHGDAGTPVQSYGAVALLSGPLALASIYGLRAASAIPAVAPVTALPRLARIETAG